MKLVIIANNPSGAQAEVQKALLRRFEECLRAEEKRGEEEREEEENAIVVGLPRHFELAIPTATAHKGVVVLDVSHEKLVTSSPLGWMLKKNLSFKYANRIMPIDETFSVWDEEIGEEALREKVRDFIRRKKRKNVIIGNTIIWCRRDDLPKSNDMKLTDEKMLRRTLESVLDEKNGRPELLTTKVESDVLVVSHFRSGTNQRAPTFGLALIPREYCEKMKKGDSLEVRRFLKPNDVDRRGENGRKERRDAPDANAVPKENSSANSQCQLCERFFMSRNAVFRHLDACDKNPLNSYKEDSSSTIANHDNVPILTSSSCVKHEKKRKREEKPPPYSNADVWFGGFPKEHATMKGLSQLLWNLNLNLKSIQAPKVLWICKKGWRAKTKNKEWLSYAFLRFRDQAEAEMAITVLNGINTKFGSDSCYAGDCSNEYRLKANARSKEKHVLDVSATRSVERNADPLEKKIYYAWLREVRDERGDETGKRVEMQECAEHPETYSWLNYDSGRELIDVEGVPVPQDMLTRLLKCLQEYRWSALSHRPSMESQHYLVLKRKSKETSNCATKISEDDVLRACCEDIMVNFAEKDFEYDSLAITKNFVASPHVDKDDMSYQFALSLGDFDSGGELMVENRLGTKRYRVNTKNRIAKCDGRSCHWVRGYSGDRYSVIWYVNDKKNFTPQTFDVDECFQPFISNDREEDSGGDDGGGLWDDEGVYDRPWH